MAEPINTVTIVVKNQICKELGNEDCRKDDDK